MLQVVRKREHAPRGKRHSLGIKRCLEQHGLGCWQHVQRDQVLLAPVREEHLAQGRGNPLVAAAFLAYALAHHVLHDELHEVCVVHAQKAAALPVRQDMVDDGHVIEQLGLHVRVHASHERALAHHAVLVELLGRECHARGARVHRKGKNLVLAKANALVKAQVALDEKLPPHGHAPCKGA